MKMIYLDSNAFYLFFFEDPKYSRGVKKIFEKMQKGEESGLTNCLTLDELAYVVLMRLIERRYKVHPSEKIREKPDVILEFLPEIEEVFETIFSFKNLTIADANKDLVILIPKLMEKSLLPRDCIHYQTMKDFDCSRILSVDSDFDRLEYIKRIKPEKIR